MQRGDSLLVIATAEHSYAFARQLLNKPTYQAAVREGRLVFADAEILLSQFMVEGEPDWVRFECVASRMLREVEARSASGALRAYGEMVGLLWQAKQFSAAVRLEAYWNQMLTSHGFDLFCAYPIDLLAAEVETSGLDMLLCAHTHMLAADRNLQYVIDRASEDVLGVTSEELRLLVEADARQLWAAMPRAEATVLWLRVQRPAQVEEVLERAREYRQALLTQ